MTSTTLVSAQDLSADRYRIEAGLPPAVAVRIADMNGDGLLDLVRLTERSLTVLLQDSAGRFTPNDAGVTPSDGDDFEDVAVGQLGSGSLLPDVAVLCDDGEVKILHNQGSGALIEVLPSPVTAPFSASGYQLLVADLDGTGGDDVLVVLHGGPQLLFLFLADGSGGFTDVTATHVTDNFALSTPNPQVALADCDGDGDPDLILVSPWRAPVLLDNDLNDAEDRGVLSLSAGAFPSGTPGARSVLATDVVGNPLPDVVLGLPGPGRRSPELLQNTGSGFVTVGPGMDFEAESIDVLFAADADGDQIADLIALADEGVVVMGKGSGTGTFATGTELLPVGLRSALAIGDLDNDGDLDLYTGGEEFEDQLLLGRGDGAFLDTEAVDFPLGAAPASHLGALADVDRDGDPDVVTYDRNGNPEWFHNDGSARFVLGDPSDLPDLPRGAGYHTLVNASVIDTDGGELLLVSNPGGARPLRILVDTGSGFVDETDLRFPAVGLPDAIALAVGPVCTSGVPGAQLDDLVIADSSGDLHLARNSGGVYTLEPGAFSGPPLEDPSRILLGDIDGDGNCDVVVVEHRDPIRLFMGSSLGTFSEPNPGPDKPARNGLLWDFNTDGNLDLILVRPTTGLIILLGDGTASFADVTDSMLVGQARGHMTDLELISTDSGGVSLLVGAGNVPDQIIPWNGTRLGPRIELPYRGSVETSDLLLGDLERDGDTDVVVLRRRTQPGLLRNTASHLSTTGTAQIGRILGMRFVAPVPDSAVFLFLGPAQPAAPTPWGLLRINPISLLDTALIAGGRELSIDWPLPPFLAPGMPSLQAAFVDPLLNITLSNLEFVVLTLH